MKKFFTFALLCAATAAQASLLTDMAGSLKGVGAIEMDIDQQKNIALFDEPIRSRLRIWVCMSGKMRIENLEPFRSLSIFDGEKLARYEFQNGSWKKLTEANPELAKRIFGQMSGVYTGKIDSGEYDVQEKGSSLTLTPKNAAVKNFIEKIIIETGRDGAKTLAKKITVIDADGDSTAMNIDSCKLLSEEPKIFDTESPEANLKGRRP